MMPRESATIHEKPDDGIVQKLMRQGISPKDFADAIGVSESSVKRWVDQGYVIWNAKPADLAERMRREHALWAEVTKGMTFE